METPIYSVSLAYSIRSLSKQLQATAGRPLSEDLTLNTSPENMKDSGPPLMERKPQVEITTTSNELTSTTASFDPTSDPHLGVYNSPFRIATREKFDGAEAASISPIESPTKRRRLHNTSASAFPPPIQRTTAGIFSTIPAVSRVTSGHLTARVELNMIKHDELVVASLLTTNEIFTG